MSMRISSQDAQIMKSGSARFPMKGTTCVPACTFYWCCQNGEDGKTCVGFQLINGQVKRHLQEQLGEKSLEYIQNSYAFIQRAIQNNNVEDAEVIIRDISELRKKAIPEPTHHKSGFLNMLAAAHPSAPSTAQSEPAPEERATSGFSAMLRASANGKKTDVLPAVERQSEQPRDIIQRHMPSDFEYRLPQICNDTCFIKRHCGAYPAQVGNLCVKRSEQYTNRSFINKEVKSE